MPVTAVLKSTAVAFAILAGSASLAHSQEVHRINGYALSSIKPGDLIKSSDIERARGNYTLKVPGVGRFLIRSILKQGGDCRVHRPSLVRIIATNPGRFEKGDVIKINKVDIPDELGLGDHICLGDGTGCELTIKPAGQGKE